jgi:hypothetical protein
MQNAEVIRDIVNKLECKPDLLVRVPCVYCHDGKTMILDPKGGSKINHYEAVVLSATSSIFE